MNLRDVHIGMYGAVMGLAGLGLSARSAATVLPGYVRAPAYVTEPWVALGALALVILLALYAAKLVRYPAAVRDDFVNPLTLGFCGALPVAAQTPDILLVNGKIVTLDARSSVRETTARTT